MTFDKVSTKEFAGRRTEVIAKWLNMTTSVSPYVLTDGLKQLATGGGGDGLTEFSSYMNDKTKNLKSCMVEPTNAVSTFSVRIPKREEVRKLYATLSCLSRFIWNCIVRWVKGGVLEITNFYGKVLDPSALKFQL